MRMMNRLLLLALALLFCATPLAAHAAAASPSQPPLTLAAEGEEPVLTLRRQANFYEAGVRSGTLIQLYADKSLEIYALGMMEDSDDPVLVHAGSVTDEEYQNVQQILGDGGFLELPEKNETGVLDGDTVTLSASTAAGAHTVSAYSPDGTPFGEIVQGIESLFGAHEYSVGE